MANNSIDVTLTFNGTPGTPETNHSKKYILPPSSLLLHIGDLNGPKSLELATKKRTSYDLICHVLDAEKRGSPFFTGRITDLEDPDTFCQLLRLKEVVECVQLTDVDLSDASMKWDGKQVEALCQLSIEIDLGDTIARWMVCRDRSYLVKYLNFVTQEIRGKMLKLLKDKQQVNGKDVWVAICLAAYLSGEDKRLCILLALSFIGKNKTYFSATMAHSIVIGGGKANAFGTWRSMHKYIPNGEAGEEHLDNVAEALIDLQLVDDFSKAQELMLLGDAMDNGKEMSFGEQKSLAKSLAIILDKAYKKNGYVIVSTSTNKRAHS
jgi:hypothetical protein